jgi:hypothetical protein
MSVVDSPSVQHTTPNLINDDHLSRGGRRGQRQGRKEKSQDRIVHMPLIFSLLLVIQNIHIPCKSLLSILGFVGSQVRFFISLNHTFRINAKLEKNYN